MKGFVNAAYCYGDDDDVYQELMSAVLVVFSVFIHIIVFFLHAYKRRKPT